MLRSGCIPSMTHNSMDIDFSEVDVAVCQQEMKVPLYQNATD